MKRTAIRGALLIAAGLVLIVPGSVPIVAVEPQGAQVTFAKDIAPILQRHCERCHRPGSIAPMALITYEQVRPYARAIKQRTALRDKPGVMPPWMIERHVGIQGFKNDPSLSEAELKAIADWADSGAQLGNPADLPKPLSWKDEADWAIGAPDLIVTSKPFAMNAAAPDWWGSFDSVPTGLTEDRYVAAYELHEVNDARVKPQLVTGGAKPTASLSVVHHGTVTAVGPNGRPEPGGCCPTHEVGQNSHVFEPKVGKLLRAGSSLAFNSIHMHANGRDTTGHLEIGLKFHPRGYTPEYVAVGVVVATNNDLIDIPAGSTDVKFDGTAVLQQNTKITVFEPHMHAAGVRFCLQAIYGTTTETLSCAGYDHNWVIAYTYADDVAPLLPKGTLLRIVGYYNTTPANRNVPDPRNWSGGGHRSVDNMNQLLGQGVALTDEQFAAAVAERRRTLRINGRTVVPGCPTCGMVDAQPSTSAAAR